MSCGALAAARAVILDDRREGIRVGEPESGDPTLAGITPQR
jgi:hypothetical protein